jgi:Zn-dependent M28 family amino/carboxypeptidase
MEDVTLGSYRDAGTNHFDAELVFVGYGVTAPEEAWDDYGDADVRGKIVVAFVGDPPGDDRFGGDAMTYYGRWTYKFERALAAGAAGCLVIHETEPASYGWNVVRSSWSGERFHVLEPGGALPEALQVQGWLHADAAAHLAALADSSLDAWHAAALDPGFRPRATGIHLSGEVVTREREMSDRNVIGMIPGSEAPDETIFVTAHWDHLGTKDGAAPGEDAIFNGAIDNASGIAGMLATATALQHRRADGQRLAHSVVFLATTAEEQGLLGSRYYAGHPLVELSKALAAINLDSMNVWGETTTITVVGPGQSDLEDSLGQVAVAQGRNIVADDHPSAGSYYRSDHFAFAQRGVPALFFHGGPIMAGGGEAEGARLAKLRSERYHTVADEYDPSWPLAGAVQDVDALTRLIVLVDAAADPPRWKPTSEFASVAR